MINHKDLSKHQLKTKCIHGKVHTRVFYVCQRDKHYDCACGRAVKCQETMLKRYGYRFALQVPEFNAKMMRTTFQPKEFTWPSGRKSLYQGYEHYLYTELLKTVAEEEIVTNRAIIKTFPYLNGAGENAIYFPDAQVGDVIYEVKSPFTYKNDSNSERKIQAVLNAKQQVELWIFVNEKVFFRRVFFVDGRKHMYYPNVITQEMRDGAPKTIPI